MSGEFRHVSHRRPSNRSFCQPIVPQVHEGNSPLSWRGTPHSHDRVPKPAVSSQLVDQVVVRGPVDEGLESAGHAREVEVEPVHGGAGLGAARLLRVGEGPVADLEVDVREAYAHYHLLLFERYIPRCSKIPDADDILLRGHGIADASMAKPSL